MEVVPCAPLQNESFVVMYAEECLHVMSIEHCELPRGSWFQGDKTNRWGWFEPAKGLGVMLDVGVSLSKALKLM